MRRDGQIGMAGDVPFELVRAITQARGTRDHWENTQENMFCMSSLLDYAQRYEAVTPAMRVAATVDGTPLGTAQFGSVRDPAVTLSRPIGPTDPGTRAQLTIERTGAGRLYYSARMRYAPTDDAAIEVNAGIDLHREYSVQRDGQWVLLGTRCRFAAASSCAWISTFRCRRLATSSSSTIRCRAASSP